MISSKAKKHTASYLFLLILVILVFAPHCQTGIFTGLDDSFHLSRIYSLAQSLKNGVFPVKVHSYMCYGTGYGVGFGYSNLFLYFPALLICFGLSLITAYKIYIFIILTALSFTIYYSIYRLTNNIFSSLLACMIILFSNRIWWDLYGLMSIGSLQASIFIILAIVGMYRFLTVDGASPRMLALGFIGLIYSHTISTFLTFTVCAFLVCIFIVPLLKNKHKLFQLILAVIMVSCITMAYWLPMIEQMKKQLLKLKAPWTTAEQHISTFKSMLSNNELGIISLVTLMITLLTIFIFLCTGKWTIKDVRTKGCFSILALIYTLATTFYGFWHFMNSTLGIKIIQFPYRLYTVVTFLIAIQIAILFAEFTFNLLTPKVIWISIYFLMFILTFFQYRNYSHLFTNIYLDTIKAIEENSIAGIGGGEEWLPINGDRKYMYNPEIATDNTGNTLQGEKSKGYTTYTITIDTSNKYYDLPFVYYKGYKVVSEHRIVYDVELNYDTGMLRLVIPENLSGLDTITVKYDSTKYAKIAYVISIFSSMFAIFLLFFEKYRRKTVTAK